MKKNLIFALLFFIIMIIIEWFINDYALSLRAIIKVIASTILTTTLFFVLTKNRKQNNHK